MHKLIIAFLVCSIFTHAFLQAQGKATTYLLAQYNKTIYDRTAGNNPSGAGVGLQTFFNNKTKFKPEIEITGDIYLEDNKVLKLNDNGTIPTKYNDVRGMVNLFGGTAFHLSQNMYLSFVAGPSFINRQAFLGVKPSIGFYFFNNNKCTGKVSYIDIINRGKSAKEDFGSISFAIGLTLF